MPRYVTTRVLRHSPQQMFDLVADIERYPEFVPMCSSLTIRRRTTGVHGSEVLLADMSIGYKMIRERFTTRVALDRPELKILVEYVDGPFSHLENRWTFAPEDPPAKWEPVRGQSESSNQNTNGCAVTFDIDYAFRSRTFQMLAGAVFDQVVRRMIEAFEERANTVYASS